MIGSFNLRCKSVFNPRSLSQYSEIANSRFVVTEGMLNEEFLYIPPYSKLQYAEAEIATAVMK